MPFHSLLHNQQCCWISYSVPCTRRGNEFLVREKCLKHWSTVPSECRGEEKEAQNSFPDFCFHILSIISHCPEQLGKKSLPRNRSVANNGLNQGSYLTKVLELETISPARCSRLRLDFFCFFRVYYNSSSFLEQTRELNWRASCICTIIWSKSAPSGRLHSLPLTNSIPPPTSTYNVRALWVQ